MKKFIPETIAQTTSQAAYTFIRQNAGFAATGGVMPDGRFTMRLKATGKLRGLCSIEYGLYCVERMRKLPEITIKGITQGDYVKLEFAYASHNYTADFVYNRGYMLIRVNHLVSEDLAEEKRLNKLCKLLTDTPAFERGTTKVLGSALVKFRTVDGETPRERKANAMQLLRILPNVHEPFPDSSSTGFICIQHENYYYSFYITVKGKHCLIEICPIYFHDQEDDQRTGTTHSNLDKQAVSRALDVVDESIEEAVKYTTTYEGIGR